jgi:hypothetical protein
MTTSHAVPAPGQLLGIDFTCAPTRRKPITVARGHRLGAVVRLDALQNVFSLDEFLALLHSPGPWLAACDFPFGLPREFIHAQGLGDSTDAVIHNLKTRCATRMDFRALVDAWGNTRPAGQRLLHRAADGAMPGISSTSPLQTRYVPVGFMYFEGLSRLVTADVHIPRMRAGDAQRVALEAYPGLLAHELLGGQRSYKNQDTPERLIARKDMVDALEQGRTRLGLRLKLSHAQREALVDDASGDRLDAALCLVQAAAVATRPGYGLPATMDPLEGWIATA